MPTKTAELFAHAFLTIVIAASSKAWIACQYSLTAPPRSASATAPRDVPVLITWGQVDYFSVDFHLADIDKKPGILVHPASFNLILVGSVYNALQGSVNSFIWSENHTSQLFTRIFLFSTARNAVDLQTRKVSAQEDLAVLWVFKLAMTISSEFLIHVEEIVFSEMLFSEIIFSADQIPAWQRDWTQ